MDFTHSDDRRMLADMAGRFVAINIQLSNAMNLLHQMMALAVKSGPNSLSLA